MKPLEPVVVPSGVFVEKQPVQQNDTAQQTVQPEQLPASFIKSMSSFEPYINEEDIRLHKSVAPVVVPETTKLPELSSNVVSMGGTVVSTVEAASKFIGKHWFTREEYNLFWRYSWTGAICPREDRSRRFSCNKTTQ